MHQQGPLVPVAEVGDSVARGEAVCRGGRRAEARLLAAVTDAVLSLPARRANGGPRSWSHSAALGVFKGSRRVGASGPVIHLAPVATAEDGSAPPIKGSKCAQLLVAGDEDSKRPVGHAVSGRAWTVSRGIACSRACVEPSLFHGVRFLKPHAGSNV